MWSRCSAFACGLLIGCCLLTSLPGCAKRQRATVKGKITFMNKPLTAGTVAFVTSDGRHAAGTITFNGEYTVPDAPVGETTITVTTPKAPMGPMAKMPKPPTGSKGMPKEMLPPGYEEGKTVQIVPAPEKYATPESSPLKYTVKPGEQTYDIDLKP
jgi:hypothetical protein